MSQFRRELRDEDASERTNLADCFRNRFTRRFVEVRDSIDEHRQRVFGDRPDATKSSRGNFDLTRLDIFQPIDEFGNRFRRTGADPAQSIADFQANAHLFVTEQAEQLRNGRSSVLAEQP